MPQYLFYKHILDTHGVKSITCPIKAQLQHTVEQTYCISCVWLSPSCMYVTRTAAPGPRNNTHHIHHIKCVDCITIASTMMYGFLCGSKHRACSEPSTAQEPASKVRNARANNPTG